MRATMYFESFRDFDFYSSCLNSQNNGNDLQKNQIDKYDCNDFV